MVAFQLTRDLQYFGPIRGVRPGTFSKEKFDRLPVMTRPVTIDNDAVHMVSVYIANNQS